jgi:hypothetical protein
LVPTNLILTPKGWYFIPSTGLLDEGDVTSSDITHMKKIWANLGLRTRTDANDGVLVQIAMLYVGNECEESWSWLETLSKEHLPMWDKAGRVDIRDGSAAAAVPKLP